MKSPPIDQNDPKAYFYRHTYQPDCARFEIADPINADTAGLIKKYEHICSICEKNLKTENSDDEIQLFDSYTKCDDDGEEFTDKKFWSYFIYKRGEKFRYYFVVLKLLQSRKNYETHA